jgi:hypothetical protein
MSNNQEIKAGQKYFALTSENGKGIQHVVTLVDEEDEGVPTEPRIYTWSDPTERGGFTWAGPLSQFKKLFKLIGFNKK